MRLGFTDGVQFDTSGELRIESRHDGLYVVGRGMLIPVRDVKEAREIIDKFTVREKPTEPMTMREWADYRKAEQSRQS